MAKWVIPSWYIAIQAVQAKKGLVSKIEQLVIRRNRTPAKEVWIETKFERSKQRGTQSWKNWKNKTICWRDWSKNKYFEINKITWKCTSQAVQIGRVSQSQIGN